MASLMVHGQMADEELHGWLPIALDRDVEILQQAHAAAAAVGIRGHLDDVHRVQDRDRAREVGEEHGARFQRSDEQGLATRVVRGDLEAELGHAHSYLRGGEVHLADGVVSYEASFSRYRWARRSRSRR
jgi:hypothetical protein